MKPLLQNLALSLGDNEEVCYCLKAWQELPSSVRNGGRPSKEEALLAVAVINRIRRAITHVSRAAHACANSAPQTGVSRGHVPRGCGSGLLCSRTNRAPA